jgi:hypothetical protein
MERKRVTRKDEINDLIQKILKTYDYGDTISFDWLEENIGYKVTDIKFSYITLTAKNELIKYGYVLTSIWNVGYKILKPNEIVLEVYNRYGLGSLSKINKGLFILNNVNIEYLNDKEYKDLEKIVALFKELRDSNENQLLKGQVLLGETMQKKLQK